jgi:hypothetical protein
MFEEEAEEYADLKCGKDNRKTTGWILTQEDFQNGATFGYNKANEWHDLRKDPDDLPKEMENVLCYCRGAGIKFCCVGHIIVGGDKKARWWANNKSEELLVIKWKEIIF